MNNNTPTTAHTSHRHDVRVPSVILEAHLFESDRNLLAVRRRHRVQLERVRADVELLDRPGACRRFVHLRCALLGVCQRAIHLACEDDGSQLEQTIGGATG